MSVESDHLLECVSRVELASLLGVSTSTLTYFAYSKGRKYKVFTIPKKSGDVRTIKAPVGGLINIQRKLSVLLNEIYPQPTYVQGFVRGGSISKNAALHINKRLILNIDLNDYFPSITSNRILGLLRSKPFNFNNEIASTITGLVCYDDTLPQGAPTSPVLSNMITLRMDKALLALCKKQYVTYSRYADDITFSTTKRRFSSSFIEYVGDDRRVTLGADLKKVIQDNYFQINQSKVRLHSEFDSKYVTGVKVNLYPNLTRTYVRHLRSMLHAWEKYGLEKAQEEFTNIYGGSGKSFKDVVQGRIAHLRNIKGGDDLVFRRLFNRFVALEGKGRKELPLNEVEDLYSRVFVIKSGNKYGTGFILDGKWLITCAHVVETDEIEYFLYTESLPAQHHLIKIRKDWISPLDKHDLIALPAKSMDLSNPDKILVSAPLPFEVMPDTACKVIGFPAYRLGSIPHIMRMHVTSLEPDKYGITQAYVDKKMISGSSGSPVINEQKEVIGMVQRGAVDRGSGDDSIGYTFLPIQEIRKCLAGFEL